MIEYKKRKGTFWKVENGVKTVISAEEYDIGKNKPISIPVPEVREYDSLEEAMADQDKDELIAEED